MIGILLCCYYGLDHTCSLMIELMIASLCDIVFMYDQILKCITRTKLLSKFQIIRSCPLLKVAHAYQNFLRRKAPSYQSMEQLGVPCVKRGEGLCCFDCNIFYFGQIKLPRYSRQAFSSCSVSNGTMQVVLNKKLFLITPDVFRGGWVD